MTSPLCARRPWIGVAHGSQSGCGRMAAPALARHRYDLDGWSRENIYPIAQRRLVQSFCPSRLLPSPLFLTQELDVARVRRENPCSETEGDKARPRYRRHPDRVCSITPCLFVPQSHGNFFFKGGEKERARWRPRIGIDLCVAFQAQCRATVNGSTAARCWFDMSCKSTHHNAERKIWSAVRPKTRGDVCACTREGVCPAL